MEKLISISLSLFFLIPSVVFAQDAKDKDGIVRYYYGSGALMAEWNYKDGKPEGITKTYYESGALKAEWNYKEGKLEGISKFYYENGGIKYIDTYKEGKLVHRKAYDEEGKFRFARDYSYTDTGVKGEEGEEDL